MSKAFIASAIQESLGCNGRVAGRAAGDLVHAIVRRLREQGGMTIPGFGTFTVRKTKARVAINPKTREAVKVRAGKTVGFKASPTLKAAMRGR